MSETVIDLWGFFDRGFRTIGHPLSDPRSVLRVYAYPQISIGVLRIDIPETIITSRRLETELVSLNRNSFKMGRIRFPLGHGYPGVLRLIGDGGSWSPPIFSLYELKESPSWYLPRKSEGESKAEGTLGAFRPC